jgi:single-stranded-DNA-specific exonuclease
MIRLSCTRWAERVHALGLDEGSRIDPAYHLRMNEHPDFGGLELEIVDLRTVDLSRRG